MPSSSPARTTTSTTTTTSTSLSSSQQRRRRFRRESRNATLLQQLSWFWKAPVGPMITESTTTLLSTPTKKKMICRTDKTSSSSKSTPKRKKTPRMSSSCSTIYLDDDDDDDEEEEEDTRDGRALRLALCNNAASLSLVLSDDSMYQTFCTRIHQELAAKGVDDTLDVSFYLRNLAMWQHQMKTTRRGNLHRRLDYHRSPYHNAITNIH
uniref:Uncharacterized protein n=1 Tax=Amphora coffeiformis TaxID=265554 RepID=A0A7S3L1J3_9STRA